MVSAGDFRNGITIEMDGQVVQIIEFQHVKPGKGAAFVRTKLRNVINGGVTDKTFRPTEKFPAARIDRVDMQYLYDDGEMYNFMKFVKENETVKVVSYQGNVFSVEPPLKVTLEVVHTEPGIKGNTSTGATKPATVETGVEVQVPLFVNIGDKIIISTQTGEYESRA